MKAPVASERVEQAAFFAWLEKASPPGLFFSATAGGDGRATRTPGYRAGLPDVLLIWKGRPIMIEMKKRRDGRVSADQVRVQREIVLCGCPVFTAYGWDEAAAFVRTVVPMRDRAA